MCKTFSRHQVIGFDCALHIVTRVHFELASFHPKRDPWDGTPEEFSSLPRISAALGQNKFQVNSPMNSNSYTHKHVLRAESFDLTTTRNGSRF